MEYKFTILGRLNGMNEYTSAQRTNKYAGSKMKGEDQMVAEYAILTTLRGVHIAKPVNIHYAFYEPNKKRDKDNIAGFAHKVIQDALVQTKVLKDDGWGEIVGFTDTFYEDKKRPRIEVTLEEVEQ